MNLMSPSGLFIPLMASLASLVQEKVAARVMTKF
jgi:hypothetical protein